VEPQLKVLRRIRDKFVILNEREVIDWIKANEELIANDLGVLIMLSTNTNDGMQLHEACEYMDMEPKALKALLVQLGYSEAQNSNCEMIPTEYVAKLEEIKADIEGITQPQMPQLPSAANEKPQSQPQQQPGQLTLANARTIAQTRQVSLEVVLMMDEQIKAKNDALDIQEGYQEEQRSEALKI
jgi:hypothetical protein